jgi:hypothetical protein
LAFFVRFFPSPARRVQSCRAGDSPRTHSLFTLPPRAQAATSSAAGCPAARTPPSRSCA